jgi:sodium/potassium-transporting ATPase subunit alpha
MSYFLSGIGTVLIVAGVLDLIPWKPVRDPQTTANTILACALMTVWIIQAVFNARFTVPTDVLLSTPCVVVRNDERVGVCAGDLVPGDVIVVRQGDVLPCDVRFVEVSPDARFGRAGVNGMYIWLEDGAALFVFTGC